MKYYFVYMELNTKLYFVKNNYAHVIGNDEGLGPSRRSIRPGE